MTWATDQTFAVYHKPELVSVSGRGYQSQEIVKMPAADVRAGNTYAFVLTGILGSFVPLPLGDAVCEVTLQASSGTVYQSQHRQDMSFEPFQRGKGGWGHPFMTIVVVPSAVAVDYTMVYRANGGESQIDAPAMQVWDLTKLGTAGLNGNMSTVTTLTTSAQRLLQGPSLTPGKKWLVYWSAEIEQRAWKEGSLVVPPVGGLWLTRFNTNSFDTNYARRYFNSSGRDSSHIGCGPRASDKTRLDRKYTRIRLGDWVVVQDQVNTLTPSVWGESLFGIGQSGFTVLHDKIHRVDMVCIDLDAATKGIETQRVDASTKLWPGAVDDLIGTRGEPRTQVKPFTVPFAFPKSATAVLGTVRAGSFAREPQRETATTANFVLDVDGGKQSPRGWVPDSGSQGLLNTLYVLLRDSAECLPTHRVVTPQLDAGAHCYRWYGRHDRTSSQTVPFWPSFYDATWLQLLGRDSFIAPQPILESAGPEVQVNVRRESATDVSSLPALPVGYSNQLDFQIVDPVDDFRSEIGYLQRLPRFAYVRRIIRWRYRGLSKQELLSTERFLRDLADTHGSFRAHPPDMLEESAYVLDVTEGWRGSKVRKTYELAFRSFELVYTA